MGKYVQKCSACGALNFTDDENQPVKLCYNCHKARVASVKPTPYLPEKAESGKAVPDDAEKNGACGQDETTAFSGGSGDPEHWRRIHENIENAVAAGCAQGTPAAAASESAGGGPAEQDGGDDEDDEDEEVVDWPGDIGQKAKAKAPHTEKGRKSIALTAIRYGSLSFTLEAKDGNAYLLGRSANQGEFLEKDPRVGNEYCYLIFRDGFWYVKDNHSKNGTAVNSKDIGEDGERILNDGDELKLGHRPDSMAFRVTING